MTITFNICNVAAGLVETVILRKFFQMVFVGNDRKTLNIYTATVLGGCSDSVKTGDEENRSETKYISRLDKLEQFCVKFGFVVSGNDDNDVVSIISTNVTEEEQGFLSQVDCIQQVWGPECEVLYNNQPELKEKFGHINSNEPSPECLAILAQNKILWIQDSNKEHEQGLSAIAIIGGFFVENYERHKANNEEVHHRSLLNDGNEKAFYRIEVPKEVKLCEGIELLNWVKTTICFKHRLHDQNLNFCIKKEMNDKTKFIAPDFTWYFSPPVKSFISYESSSVEVSWQKKNDNNTKCALHEGCKCPVKPENKKIFTSKRYDNIINPVANKTTVNFNRWTKDEMIGCRNKYKMAQKNIFSNPESFDDVRELNIFIDTTDEHGRGNRQYILGIFISFALAFGIDKTRLSDAQMYFPFKQLFLADTWWLFLIISITLNLLIRPIRGIQKRKYVYWRTCNIVFSLVWIFMAFCVDRSILLTNWFNSVIGTPFNNLMEKWISPDINYYFLPRGMLMIILISNIAYAVWNIKKYHDPVISSLLGEDIL